MVRVNDDWVVDVDTYNYILKRDMHRMVRGKKKEDPDVPLYTIKGYFPSLPAALNIWVRKWSGKDLQRACGPCARPYRPFRSAGKSGGRLRQIFWRTRHE